MPVWSVAHPASTNVASANSIIFHILFITHFNFGALRKLHNGVMTPRLRTLTPDFGFPLPSLRTLDFGLWTLDWL